MRKQNRVDSGHGPGIPGHETRLDETYDEVTYGVINAR